MKSFTPICKGLLAVYLVAQVIGLAVFCCESPRIETPPIAHSPTPAMLNLADYRTGARVAVSSYDWFRSHHPLFAIDGQARPGQLEKWATIRSDKRPWLEVVLARPGRVAQVGLVFAGAYESSAFTIRNYRVMCLSKGQVQDQVQVTKNRNHRPIHNLDCPAADKVRVEFETVARTPLDVVRLYEIQIWPQAQEQP